MGSKGRGDRGGSESAGSRRSRSRRHSARRTWRGEAAPLWAATRVLNFVSEMRERLGHFDAEFFADEAAVEASAASMLLASHVAGLEQRLAPAAQPFDRQVLAAMRSLASGLAVALQQDTPQGTPRVTTDRLKGAAVEPLRTSDSQVVAEAVETGRVLRTDTPPAPPPRSADPGQLYQQLLLYAQDLARLYQAYRQMYQDVRSLKQTMAATEKAAAAGLLSGGILHDVNHFLTVIQGAAELLLSNRAEFSEQVREDLEAIVDSARKAAVLVQRYQVLSRPGPVQSVPFNLADVAASAVGILARQLKKRDIRCVLDLNENVPAVIGDPVAMEEVVLNLVRNAIEVLKSGGRIRIAVDVARRQDGGQEVLLLVEDDGPGIPKELHEKIFEPFATFRPGGTGLGLHIVKSIVERHNGKIHLFSEPGRGAKFLIRVPAAES